MHGRLVLAGQGGRSAGGRLARLMAAVLGALCACLAGPRAGRGQSPGPVFSPLTGHFYELLDAEGVTWKEARAISAGRTFTDPQGREFAGYLASLTSAEEARWVQDLVVGATPGQKWLGAYQSADAGSSAEGWSWVTSEAWDYARWDGDQPDDPEPGSGLALDAAGRWCDEPVDAPGTGFIVEYGTDPPPVRLLDFDSGPVLPAPATGPLLASDADVDGHLDLLAASGGDLCLLYGLGDGGFLPPVCLGLAEDIRAIGVGDLTADGLPDLCLAGGGGIVVLRASGPRSYLPARRERPVGGPIGDLMVADLDGSGRPDLLFTDLDGGRVGVLLNDGRSGFRVPAFAPAGESPVRMAVMDWNRDGFLDAACTTAPAGRVLIYSGGPSGQLRRLQTLDPGTSSPAAPGAADLDGDGLLELVVTAADVPGLILFPGRERGGFSPGRQVGVAAPAEALFAADMDGDGRPDLAMAHPGAGYWSALRVDGGLLSPACDFPLAAAAAGAMAAGDFDEDGRPDLAVVLAAGGGVALALNRTPAEHPPLPSGVRGWWRAEQDARDSAGRLDGRPVDEVRYDAGRQGASFAFGSLRSEVRVPDDPALRLQDALTIVAWVNVESIPVGNGGRLVFGRGDSRLGMDPYRLEVRQDGKGAFSLTALGSVFQLTFPLPARRWVHVAARLDLGISRASILLDGQVAAEGHTVVRPFRLLDPDRDPHCSIGAVARPTGDPRQPVIAMRLDEVRVFGRALSDAEIRDLAAAEISLPQTPAGLTATPWTATSVLLEWEGDGGASASARTRLAAEVGLELFRRSDGGAWEGPIVLEAGADRYLDEAVAKPRRVRYRLRARNGAGVSGFTPVVTVEMAREGVLEAAPSVLNFGRVRPGRTSRRTLKLRNRGSGLLHGFVEPPPGPYSILAGGGRFVLGPGKARRVTIRAENTTGKSLDRLLTIVSTDPKRHRSEVQLTGRTE